MIVAVVPAYNEEKTLLGVINDISRHVDKIIVVDDGSTDETKNIALTAGVEVISHQLNQDLGATLKTGLMAAVDMGAEWVITIDADGQLLGEDIPKLLNHAKERDLQAVLGSRFIDDQSQIPLFRYFANTVGNVYTWLLFGVWASDTQCGLRCFHRSALEKINLLCKGMEVSSEFVAEIARNNLRWDEIPVKVIYTPYSLSKGQSARRGFKTAWKLFLRRLG